MLFRSQLVRCAVRRADTKAGNNIAASTAMIAITTSNSTNVKPRPVAREVRPDWMRWLSQVNIPSRAGHGADLPPLASLSSDACLMSSSVSGCPSGPTENNL